MPAHKPLPQLLRETAFSYLKAKEMVMESWESDCECDPSLCDQCLPFFAAKVKARRQQLWEQQSEMEQQLAIRAAS